MILDLVEIQFVLLSKLLNLNSRHFAKTLYVDMKRVATLVARIASHRVKVKSIKTLRSTSLPAAYLPGGHCPGAPSWK